MREMTTKREGRSLKTLNTNADSTNADQYETLANYKNFPTKKDHFSTREDIDIFTCELSRHRFKKSYLDTCEDINFIFTVTFPSTTFFLIKYQIFNELKGVRQQLKHLLIFHGSLRKIRKIS